MQRLVFLFFLFPVQITIAQVILPPLLDVNKIKPVFVEFKASKRQEKSSFSSFAIEDERLDKYTVGHIRFTPDYKKYNRLEWKDGAKTGERFLNDYFSPSADADTIRLLIRLRNFFITQDYQSPQSNFSLTEVIYQSKVFVMADLLIEKSHNRFYLTKVDTVITVQKWLGKAYNQLAQTALLQLVTKAEDLLKYGSLAFGSELSSSDTMVNIFPSTISLKDGFYLSYNSFLRQQPLSVSYRLEQRKKVQVAVPAQEADSSVIKNSWGFVKDATLYVRNGSFYIPLQENRGSWSGIGISFSDVKKVPIAGALTLNPLMFAADMADLAINGSAAKLMHYCLYRLNIETGQLE